MRSTRFLDIIAKFEDVNLPLWSYMKFKAGDDVKHWIRSTIRELKWTIELLKHAERRLDINDKDLNKKFEFLVEVTEE